MSKVKLSLTWVWDCPHCHHRNVTNGVVSRDMTDDELEELSESVGDPSGGLDRGTALLTPEEVVCADCLGIYDVDFEDMEEL